MKKFVKDWGLVIAVGMVILGLGLILRLINLAILPVFADEAIYIRWAQVMGNEPTLRFLPLSDGKQPLFMWILMFLVTRFPDPLFIGRLVSVVSGLGTMVGLFALTFYLFKNKWVALVSSFLWALSPFPFFFDRMALVDSLLACLGVWTIFLNVVTVKTKRWDVAMLTGFALGFAALTKSPAVFIAILLPAAWILADWPRAIKGKLFLIVRLGTLLAVTFVIALFMYNIQRLGPNFNMLTSRTGDYVFPISHLWENPKDPFIFHFHRNLEWLWIMGPVGVMVLGLLGVLVNVKKYPKEMIYVFLCWLFPVSVQAMFAKVFTARYVLFTVPFVFVLASSVFLIKNKVVKILGVLGLFIFVAQSSWFNYLLLTNPERADLPRGERSGYLEEWTAGTGIREVSEFLKEEHAKDSDTQIVVGTEGYFGTLPDGLQIYMDKTPKVVILGIGLDITGVNSSLWESFEAGNKTYVVINSSRLKIKEADWGSKGLKLLEKYPKALRPDGYKEFVTHGPRDFLYLFEVIESVAPKYN